MKTQLYRGIGLAIALFPVLTVSYPAGAQNENRSPLTPHITVTGQGEVKVKPDKMDVTIGVVTEDKSSQTAAKTNALASQRVQDVIKKAGVADKDIQTVNYSVLPIYNTPPVIAQDRTARKPQIVSYRVYNQVRVTVRDLAKISDVLDAATAAGSNSIEDIAPGLEDQKAAEGDALEKAVQDARRKADRLAKAANVIINGVLEISDTTGYGPRPLSFARMEKGGGAATPIAPGELTVTANVTVIYKLN